MVFTLLLEGNYAYFNRICSVGICNGTGKSKRHNLRFRNQVRQNKYRNFGRVNLFGIKFEHTPFSHFFWNLVLKLNNWIFQTHIISFESDFYYFFIVFFNFLNFTLSICYLQSEPSVRGILIGYSNINIRAGTFAVYVLNTLMAWRTVALICLTVPIASIISLCFVSFCHFFSHFFRFSA